MSVDSLIKNEFFFMALKLTTALLKVYFLVMTSKSCKKRRHTMFPQFSFLLVATVTAVPQAPSVACLRWAGS